jgi:hypothetical protein
MLPKQFEGMNDVALRKVRAVTADNHYFAVSNPDQTFDRVLQPLAERSSLLVVNLARWRDHATEALRCEKVNINPSFFSEAKALRFQEDAESDRPTTLLAIGVGRVSENEQGARFHLEAFRF